MPSGVTDTFANDKLVIDFRNEMFLRSELPDLLYRNERNDGRIDNSLKSSISMSWMLNDLNDLNDDGVSSNS